MKLKQRWRIWRWKRARRRMEYLAFVHNEERWQQLVQENNLMGVWKRGLKEGI